ncbi:MAG: sigma-70 family RNA polymerase sigma factor [Planctomycetota bacterium]|nr:sigma-70 family RNA polymerase sigma factor [Planctomycetota bacterium]
MESAGAKITEAPAAEALPGAAPLPGGSDDRELLRRLNGPGAEAALGALIERHGPMVLRAARRVTGDGHRAEDVLQAVFLILYQKAGSLGAVGSLGGWLYRTAVLAAKESVRAEARRKRREDAVAQSAEARTAEAPPELPPGFDAALERLPAVYRDVIVLRFLRGRSLEETAAELKLNPGTVATRTSRGLDRLRRALETSACALAAGTLAQALAAEGAQAAAATIQAAQIASVTALCLKGAGAGAGGGLALAQGVKSSLFYAKLKLGLAAAALMVTAGAVSLTLAMATNEPAAASAEQLPGATIRFVPDAAASSELSAAMLAWKDEELERQGGRLSGSHAWWPWGLTVFDADGDGRPDVLVDQMGAPGSRVFLNRAAPGGGLSFSSNTLPASGRVPSGGFPPEAVDLDRDGFPDLVFKSAEKSNCYLNKGGQGFEAIAWAMPEHESFQRTGVEEGSGAVFLIGERTYYRYDVAAKTFRARPWTHPAAARAPKELLERIEAERAKPEQRFLRIRWREDVDLNGDGRADLICAGPAAYQGRSFGCYLLSDERGALRDATAELGLPESGTPVFAGDLCGDGTACVAVSHGSAPGYYRWTGARYERQAGALTERLKRGFESPHALRQADFNGDGRPDLLLACGRSNFAVVFENLGDGSFREAFRLPVWTGDAVRIADLDGDGRLDLIAGGPGDRITLYRNVSGDALEVPEASK